MARRRTSERSSTQYLADLESTRLERLAGLLGVAQGRVLGTLLSARTDEEVAAYIGAQQYLRDPSRPVPVLLDGPVVASMAGAITQSVSSLLGNLLPDLVLAVLAAQAERRPDALAGTVGPILDRLVPMVLDRLIAEQGEIEGPLS